jgi:branched-chain amino acid transport system substrate-binding protein
MKKIIVALLCAILVQGVFAGGGQQSGGAAPAAGDKNLTFGVLAPLTGTNAEYGKGFQVAMGMAVDEINAAGGTSNGYKFELQIRDSKGDPKESSDLTRQFADNPDISAILGDFTSGACMADAPIVDEAGIVLLSPTASNPQYAGMSPFCFSTMGRTDAEGPFNARYFKDTLKVNNIAVLYINSDWGTGCFRDFKAEADKIGLNITVALNYVQDEKDFSSYISRLRATPGIELVEIMDQGAVPQIVNQIRGAGWDIPLAALGPGTSEQIIQLCGKNAEGLLVSNAFMFDPSNQKQMAWQSAFVAAAGFQPTVHPVLAYDCVYLLKAAVEACGTGSVTRDAIRQHLQNNPPYSGISGRIQFNPAGDITRQFLMCQVKDGKFVIVQGFDG